MQTMSLGDLVGATVTRFRLVSEERRLGAKLHETLQIDLPEIASLDLAARYRSAGDAVTAGGDFAEVSDLGDVVGVVIGDIVGHGVDAAVRSVQLRSDLATALHITRDPAMALRVLDDRSRGRGDRCIATAMCLVVHPVSGQVSLATAGHPPPLLIGSDHTSEWLIVPAGPPVGVPGIRPEPIDVWLGRDEMLMCFTDGIIERPGALLDDGVAQLAARVCAGDTTSVDDAVDSAMDAATDIAEGRDDAVALALRLR